MNHVSNLTTNDLSTITQCLNKNDFKSLGKMMGENGLSSLVNNFSNRSQPRLLAIIKKVNESFAALEQKGIKIFPKEADSTQEIADCALKYRKTRRIYFETVQAIESHIKQLKTIDKGLKNAFHELQCREIAHRYSLGKDNGGLDPLDQYDSQSFKALKDKAKAWKLKQNLVVNADLNELETEQLEEMAKYPEWIKIVLDNPATLHGIFNWCLRDFNQVEVMVKCFETQNKLRDALLHSNLGYVRNLLLTKKENEVLAFQTVPTKVEGVSRKILTLSIYHGSFEQFEKNHQQRINILNPKETILFKNGNYQLTVEEFFKELGSKNLREANINLCADWGFVNFHSVKGVWNADKKDYDMPVMNEKNWEDHIPPSRIASHEEVLAQYKNDIQDRKFFFKVMSTRQNRDMNVLKCHAYWQLFFRMKDGNWKIINIGIYAFRFQQGVLDGLWLFCHTLRRVISLIDQNGYYTHRQRGGCAIFPSKEDQEKFLERIYRLMNSAGVFQFAGNNSLDWKWKGVLHEYLNCPNCKSHVKINGVKKIYFSDGARSQDPKKHEKDAQVLEEALKDDPTNSRYVFYLAQSYRNARDYASALKNYEKRAQMDGGNEEIFLSKLEIAKMQEALNKPIEITAKSYLDAYDYRPSRAEPLFYAAQLYRIHNDFEKAYKIATQGIVIPMPKDILFVEKWIYDFGMEYELAKNAYWIGHYEECQKLCQNLLSNNKLPENIRQIVEKMLSLANQQILKKFQNQFQS